MTNLSKLSKSDMILLAIATLKKEKPKQKITKEDLVIKVWKLFPSDFCIKGYMQYPDADITKYFTKLFKNRLLQGNVNSYVLTSKGEDYAQRLEVSETKNTTNETVLREIEVEINRILNSNVFKIFLSGDRNFIESDFFEFLGTTSRTFGESNKTRFNAKYSLISKEIIPFCKNSTADSIIKICELWVILLNKFKHLLKGKGDNQ